MEEVLGAEETPRRVGLHAQEPVQKRRGVSTFSSRSSLWYDGCVSSKNPELLIGLDSALTYLMWLPLTSKNYLVQALFHFLSSLHHNSVVAKSHHQCTIGIYSELQGFRSASFECTKTNGLFVAPLCFRKV